MRQSIRFAVLDRDQFRCRYCGRGLDDEVKLHVDHVHPKSKGGPDEMENLVTACWDCNIGKGDRLLLPVPSTRTYRSRGARTPSAGVEMEALRVEFPIGSHCCTPLKVAAIGMQLGISTYAQAYRYVSAMPGAPPVPPLRATDASWYRIVRADMAPQLSLVQTLR